MKMQRMVALLLALLYSSSQLAFALQRDGLLPNGDFEKGPKQHELKGTKVTSRKGVPNWEVSGLVEYIKSGQKQGDMVLVVPEGAHAVRLGNEASIKQTMTGLSKGAFYSITLSAARTCAQEERLNVSISPSIEPNDYGVFPIQTLYSSNGWDSYCWAFVANETKLDLSIHNPGVEEDPACGPLIDSVAISRLYHPIRTGNNLIKNGDFEQGPYIFPQASWGVLIPTHVEDSHSPLPGWIVESLKAVKYIDSAHFSTPKSKRAIELVGGKESAITQVVRTIKGMDYVLSFLVGDAKNACEGSLAIEAYAGRDTVKVPFISKGKGEFKRGVLRFKAVSDRTRVMFLSTYYNMKSDNSGSLCGPVVDDVRLVNARRHIY